LCGVISDPQTKIAAYQFRPVADRIAFQALLPSLVKAIVAAIEITLFFINLTKSSVDLGDLDVGYNSDCCHRASTWIRLDVDIEGICSLDPLLRSASFAAVAKGQHSYGTSTMLISP
jgi:hypothetical protein